LSVYTLRVRDLSDEYLNLDTACGQTSLFEIFSRFLDERETQASHDSSNKKLLRVSRKDVRGRTIRGIIETGEYGYESDLYDVKHNKVSYKRRVNDAEIFPFYFLLSLPKNRDKGILILERFGQFGIRKLLGGDFNQYFADHCGDNSLRIYPLTSQHLIDEIVRNCRVTKVRLIQFNIRKDIADAYDRGVREEEQGHLELAVIAKRDGSIPILGRLREVVEGRRDMNRLIEIRDFPYNAAKVEVDFGGRRRTVDLSRFRELRAYYDITNSVRTGANGHPIFESVDGVANEILSNLMKDLG